MPLLDLRNLSRSYGRVQALRDVTLRLEPGTIGLVGNNGAGKSTLLKILLGLLKPDSGGGTILDYDLRHAGRELRGRVGYMPETAATVPVLRGVEFVALSGDLYGMPRRDARRRAHEVLNYVGLGELRYRRLEEYSTGNLQRLKLAAALVHDPQLLLLDEPTNGLDPAGRLAMLQLLEDLIAETGKSLILCTHLLTDVERLCRQIVVLHRGTAIRAGMLGELRAESGGRYQLAWTGDGEQFLARLIELGVSVEPHGRGPEGQAAAGDARRARVVTPPEWPTRQFFEVARDCGIVLIEIKPEEEDLEKLFLRITHYAAPDQSSVAASIS